VVNVAATATTIDSLIPEPSTVAVPVRVYFTVAVTAPGAGTPTGQVAVTSNEALAQCTGSVGQGYCDITFAVVGSKTLTAAYDGDANFQTSTSASVPHTVNLVVGSASGFGALEANGMMFANLELGTGRAPQSARGRPTAAHTFEGALLIQRTLGPVRL
jgi:hypothetical protein